MFCWRRGLPAGALRAGLRANTTHAPALDTARGRGAAAAVAADERIEAEKLVLYGMIREAAAVRSRARVEERIAGMLREIAPCMHLFNVLLRARVMLNDVRGIKETLGLIGAHGLEPNLITYNVLLNYYRNHQLVDEAERLFERMLASGVAPDRYTYTTLLAAFARIDLGRAERYFALMRSSPAKALQPDLFAYNTMIGALAHAGQMERALAACAALRAAGLHPNYVTFKILVGGLVGAGRVEEAWRVYEGSLAASPEMTLRDFAEVFGLFLARPTAHIDKAVAVLGAMRRRFGQPDPRSVVRLVACAARRGEGGFAGELFEEYVARAAREHVAAYAPHLPVLLRACEQKRLDALGACVRRAMDRCREASSAQRTDRA